MDGTKSGEEGPWWKRKGEKVAHNNEYGANITKDELRKSGKAGANVTKKELEFVRALRKAKKKKVMMSKKLGETQRSDKIF